MSMSGRLALLSIIFILMVEISILVPSLTFYRINLLQEHVDDASLVAEALLSTPEANIDSDQSEILLKNAGVLDIAIIRDDRRERLLIPTESFVATKVIDLTKLNLMSTLIQGTTCAFWKQSGVIRVVGKPTIAADLIETSVRELPLCQEVRRFGFNLLGISLMISLIAGAILYYTVNQLLVRPILFLTRAITRFKGERNAHLKMVQARSNIKEIKAAEISLRDMQERILKSMGQKERLANLGESVAKIQHDLRNMLSTAQMVADNLEESNDPKVRRSAPRLVRAIDRAIELSSQTLEYGRVGERPASNVEFPLEPLLQEIAFDEIEHSKMGTTQIEVKCELDHHAFGDPSFIRRIIQNLVRNARQILDENEGGMVMIVVGKKYGRTTIAVCDNGPGFSDAAIEVLFQPFKGSTRIGGTGLGLAISKELSQLMKGDLELTKSDASGSDFTLTLPKKP